MKTKRHIFNTTFIVEEKSEPEWVAFMQEKYIGYLSCQKLTSDILFTKVSIDQPEGKTYSLQLIFPSGQALLNFLENHLDYLDEKIISHYKNHYLCFSSTLTEI